jgi:flagellar hook protein FlgE
MLGAIYIGLSGMSAYSKGLQIISNNVANLNTPGFKSASVEFANLYDGSGGGGLSYLGSNFAPQGGQGVRVGDSLTDFKQGDLRQTNNDLDLALQGGGFLVLLNGSQTLYARTGQFAVDKDGYIAEQGTGYHLGILDSTGHAVALNVDAKRTQAPAQTTKITFADNISSSGTSATVSDMTVVDDSGGKHVWTTTFTKDPAAINQWNVAVTDTTGTTLGTSVLKFVGGAVDPTTQQMTVTTTPDGAGSLSVVLDFSDVSSFSEGTSSTIRAASVDGSAPGNLTTVTVDNTGQILLTYSNGKTQQEGAVAIADFRDPQGLKQTTNGLFKNENAGEMRLRASGVDGVGTLVSKQLEASNVDLSAEFGDLILVQRGFQACSQVVSVSNDMIQQLFGIRGQG